MKQSSTMANAATAASRMRCSGRDTWNAAWAVCNMMSLLPNVCPWVTVMVKVYWVVKLSCQIRIIKICPSMATWKQIVISCDVFCCHRTSQCNKFIPVVLNLVHINAINVAMATHPLEKGFMITKSIVHHTTNCQFIKGGWVIKINMHEIVALVLICVISCAVVRQFNLTICILQWFAHTNCFVCVVVHSCFALIGKSNDIIKRVKNWLLHICYYVVKLD